jgi:hypothetical protein
VDRIHTDKCRDHCGAQGEAVCYVTLESTWSWGISYSCEAVLTSQHEIRSTKLRESFGSESAAWADNRPVLPPNPAESQRVISATVAPSAQLST